MKQIKEKPILGREYLVYDGNVQQKSVKCIYLGKKPVKTELFKEQKNLEGHIFFRLNEKKELEFYNTRCSNQELPICFHSDGEDGPEWPAGFSVSKFRQYNPSNLEIEFLNKRINYWSKK